MNKFSFSKLHLQKPKPKALFIKDAVHKEINFSEEQFWLYELVNTPEFQRLLNLRQLALTWFNFPSSTHTRFIHSLGVYEICNRFIANLLANGDLDKSRDWKEINVALAYALLHDIGHGPLSHAFEELFKEEESSVISFQHERMGFRIVSSPATKINALLKKKALDDDLEENFYVEEIGKIFKKNASCKWIADMVDSHIDIDRLDYLKRDSYYSGVTYGNAIDLSLLVRWSVIKKDQDGERRFTFLTRAENHLKQLLFAREMMQVDLYFNGVTIAYENILKKIVDGIREKKDEFSKNEKFQKIAFIFNHPDTWDIESFLSLHDDNFLQTICDLLEDSEGELKKFRGHFFGLNNSDTEHSSIDEYKKPREITKKYKLIKLKLWDPEEKTFVEVNI